LPARREALLAKPPTLPATMGRPTRPELIGNKALPT
jgi:hypothetical protein